MLYVPDSHQVQVNGGRLAAELRHLACFTCAEPSGEGTAVTRLVFSPDDLAARAWLRSLADAEGLTCRIDAVGNTFFRWEGSEPELPAVATGSHIDAIPHAGMYDGTVGVLGGLEAIRALKAADFQPRRSVELVLLTSEEPTRFGIGCLGSRLLSGTLDPVRADSLPEIQTPEVPGPAAGQADAIGGTLQSFREAAGFAGDLSGVRMKAGHYAGWIELHIEQGPLLEREGAPIGVVTSIAAPAAYRFTVEGHGGHAGALLMPDRKDALCAAAEAILAVERRVLAANAASGANDTVGTVGTCAVHPGAVNSVPSRVVLQLDIRDTDADRREDVMRTLRGDLEEIAGRRGVRIAEEMVNADLPATSSAAMVDAIEEACQAAGLASSRMVSRAYHDTLFMARICPVAMIFIPCRNGVSHRPDEFATQQAIVNGTRVLALSLAKLACAEDIG